MNVHVGRYDLHYEVGFIRPAFSHISSFPQIIEPIFDAFSDAGVKIPTDALRVEQGDSIATAKVSLSLFSGTQTFEARLDGYKAHFHDLRSSDAIKLAKYHANLFSNTICEYLSDGDPEQTVITIPAWFIVKGGVEATDALISNIACRSASNDPFKVGADTVTSEVTFHCTNKKMKWDAVIIIARSQLPNTQLFLEVAVEYGPDSHPSDNFQRTEHVEGIWNSVANSLGLTVS